MSVRKKTKKRPSLQESDLLASSSTSSLPYSPSESRSKPVTLKGRLSLELKNLSHGSSIGRTFPHRTPSSGGLGSPSPPSSGQKRASTGIGGAVEGERKVSNPLFQYADLIQASQNRNKVWGNLASSPNPDDEAAPHRLRNTVTESSTEKRPNTTNHTSPSPLKYSIPVPPPPPPPLRIADLKPQRLRGPDGLPEEMSMPFKPRERRTTRLRRTNSTENLLAATKFRERKPTAPLERVKEGFTPATAALRKIRSDSILYRFPDANADSDSDDDDDLSKSTDSITATLSKPIDDSMDRLAPTSNGSTTTEEEVPSSPRLTTVHEDQIQWESRDGRRIIVAGSLDRLIAQLIETNHSEKLTTMTGHSGPDYVYTFLLSHTYFTTSPKLMEKLQEHFVAAPPPGLTEKELKALESKILAKHSRIVNTLKRWIDAHYYFFEHDPQLVAAFQDFMSVMYKQGEKHREWAIFLRKALEERPLRKDIQAAPLKCADPALKPILPINMQSDRMMFLDLHPLEVARQMTLIEFNLFRKIQPNELHHSSWTKGKSPNVQALTERFNKVCFWVATEIITTEDPYMRIEVLSRFIQVALYLRSMNNFHGVMEIYASLNLGCVQRLKSTWKELDKKYISKLKEIETMFDPSSNYKNYRDRLEVIEPPLIPFQAVFLADLTFIEEVPSHLKNGMVNFEKMHLIGKVISEVERYQKTRYKFYVVLPIEEYLTNVFGLNEKDLYDAAKKAEQMAQAAEKEGERLRGATLGGSLRRRDRKRPGLDEWMPQAFLHNEKQLKDLEKQEKKLQRSISFRLQNKGRNRSSTYSG